MIMEYYHSYFKKGGDAFEGFPEKELSLQMHLSVLTFISSNNIRLLQEACFGFCLLKL